MVVRVLGVAGYDIQLLQREPGNSYNIANWISPSSTTNQFIVTSQSTRKPDVANAGPGLGFTSGQPGVDFNIVRTDLKNPQRIIVDDDFVSDWDGSVMMGVLNHLADRGECQIMAVMVSVVNGSGIAAASAIMNYAGRSGVPIGLLTDRTINSPSTAVGISIASLPNSIPSGHVAENSTVLFRRTLVACPNGSVKLLFTGSMANLRLLYESSADGYSALSGSALIAAKVSEIIVMGGEYPTSVTSEHNFVLDPDSNYVLPLLPVPVTFIGHEIGTQSIGTYPTGMPLANPQRAGYIAYGTGTGIWDPLAAIYAVRGLAYGGTTYFSRTTGTLIPNTTTGANSWNSSGTQSYLRLVFSATASVNLVKSLATQIPQFARYLNAAQLIEANGISLIDNGLSPFITGGSTGLSINSGGTNQNIRLNPSGTGILDIVGPISSNNSIRSSSATAGVGYQSGSGGMVTQQTSKSTGVSIAKICGTIILNNESLAAGAAVTFIVTNLGICTATDIILATMVAGSGTDGGYLLSTIAGAGLFKIIVFNCTNGALAEAIQINYSIIKSVSS